MSEATVYYNNKNYLKICLCGSTKLKEEFIHLAKALTLDGYIVTMPMIFGHSGDTVTEEQKQQLDDLHKAKILDANVVLILCKNGYIGESTRSEIEFAKKHDKRILYHEVC